MGIRKMTNKESFELGQHLIIKGSRDLMELAIAAKNRGEMTCEEAFEHIIARLEKRYEIAEKCDQANEVA